jgi:O-methyltransferase
MGVAGCKKTIRYDAGARKKGNDWPPFGHTMIGHLRIKQFDAAIRDVVRQQVPGDIVELGVWRGGACIYARGLLEALGDTTRKVYLFDIFGLVPGKRVYAASSDFLAVSLEQVKHNFEKYGLLDDRVVFVKGLFRDTVKSDTVGDFVSVLRLDGNFYDSYQDALYAYYEKVPVGGYVIFDDIGSHPPVQEAWRDFQQDQEFKEKLVPIDDHGAYFRKTQEVRVHQDRKRPSHDVNT